MNIATHRSWKCSGSDDDAQTPSNSVDDTSECEEGDLILRAASDPQALSQLYRRHYAAIAAYIQRRVGCAHEAEDLISETFVAMVKNLPRYQLRGAPFRAWLYRLATTQINRWARSKRRMLTKTSAQRDLMQASDTSDDEVQLLREQERVRSALLAIPARFQNVLALHYLEGMSVDEVAEVLGCRPGTVKSRLSRGRDKMREQLKSLSRTFQANQHRQGNDV